MKRKAFPNETFESQDEYFKFVMEHHIFGVDAYKLKKQLDKKKHLPEPKIKGWSSEDVL